MDRALSALFRPRHLTLTCLVFLSLGGLAGAIVGAAAAADPDASMDGVPLASFELPLPFVGDAGHYEVRPRPGHSAEVLEQASERAIDFQWYEDQVLRDDQGVARWANVVRVNVTEMRSGAPYHDDEIIGFHPGTPDGFAILRVEQASAAQEGTRRSSVTSQTSFIDRDNTLPCLFRNPFQGQERAVPTGALPSPPYCRVGPDFGVVSGDQLVGVAAAEKDGVRYLLARVQGSFLDASATFLFRHDIPYPIQMAQEGQPYAFVLTAFTRGTVAARADAHEVAAPPPALEMVPMQPWGPDDAGVAHTFGAREAFERLRDNATTGVADFLASHPEAYVADIYYSNQSWSGSQGHSNSWHFVFTDGVESMDASARRIDGRTSVVSSQLAGPLGLLGLEDPMAGTAPESPEYHLSGGSVQEAQTYPLPSAVPAIPTLASALAQWQAYASPAFQGMPGNNWRMSLSCFMDDDILDCTRTEAILTVGVERTHVDEASGEQTHLSSGLWWYAIPERDDLTFAHPYFYSDQRTDWRPAAQAGSGVGEAPPYRSSQPGLLSLAIGGVWVFPSAQESAAIGLGAVAGAALYWLWPLAKGGSVGLFSRVQKDRLLDNPLRSQLFQRIEAEPGVHHNALVRSLGKGKGAAEHHLDKLVAARLVLRHRGTGYTCYFPVGTDHRHMAASGATKADGARQVLEAMRNGVTGVRGIAIVTDLAPSTVSHHIERLRAAGLVVGDGRSGYHLATPSGGAAAQAA